jgi:hypothetical protein
VYYQEEMKAGQEQLKLRSTKTRGDLTQQLSQHSINQASKKK